MPSEAALWLLRWSCLSQWWLLASQSADDMAPIRVAGFGYIEHAMPIGAPTPQIEFQFSTKLDKHFFTSLAEFDFRDNSENACSVIHFSTDQMHIKFNCKTKSNLDLANSSFNLDLRPRPNEGKKRKNKRQGEDAVVFL